MNDKIKARIVELNDIKAKLIGQVNAVNGAIQELENLLKEDIPIEKKEE